MPRTGRLLIILLFCGASLLGSITSCFGRGYKGFKLLNPDVCTPIDPNMLSQLPDEWHSYAGFIKVCQLKQNKSKKAKISIITVWAYDYYIKLPKGTIWKEVPHPMIVDNNNKQVGQLPEAYPENPPCTLDIYLGKWHSGVPNEIRVDVNNPTVTGDYYYAPLILNNSSGRYEMKDEEEKHGKRPK